MELILASAGSYPHSGPGAELQVLLAARGAVARGEKTAADLSDAENFMIRRAIEEQVSAGFERVTDGLTRWLDPVSHLAAKLEGVRLGGQRPLPGGGSFQIPVLLKKPARRAPMLADEYRFACNALGALSTPHGKAGKLSVKTVLTGPFTLAKLSEAENPAMASLEARADAYSAALAAEVAALAEGGAEQIQVDEFAPAEGSADWDLITRAQQPLAQACERSRGKGRRVELILALQFPGVATHFEALGKLPGDVLGLDLATEPALYDRVTSFGAPKPLHLGLVSQRNAELENTRDLARRLEALLPKLPSGRAYLGPADGLHSLPRDRAREKLALVARVREIVAGRPVPL